MGHTKRVGVWGVMTAGGGGVSGRAEGRMMDGEGHPQYPVHWHRKSTQPVVLIQASPHLTSPLVTSQAAAAEVTSLSDICRLQHMVVEQSKQCRRRGGGGGVAGFGIIFGAPK